MNICNFLRRVFHRRPKPARRVEYLPASALPGDPIELERLGVVRPWRVEAATGEPWFVAESGAIQWWQKNLGGQADAS